jgi:membrane glycosyltransferase
MVQQTKAVGRALVGLRQGWAPQNRHRADLSLGEVASFHRVETALGLALIAGIIAGAVSPWLLGVAVPLALAIPLSIAGSVPTRALPVPEDHDPPHILRQALVNRCAFKAMLHGERSGSPLAIAAE